MKKLKFREFSDLTNTPKSSGKIWIKIQVNVTLNPVDHVFLLSHRGGKKYIITYTQEWSGCLPIRNYYKMWEWFNYSIKWNAFLIKCGVLHWILEQKKRHSWKSWWNVNKICVGAFFKSHLRNSISVSKIINTTAITKAKRWSLFTSNLNNFWVFVLSIYFTYHLIHKSFLESVVEKNY